MRVPAEIRWADLIEGVEAVGVEAVGDEPDERVRIRLARPADRARLRELGAAAVSSPALHDVYDGAGGTGAILAALSRGHLQAAANRRNGATLPQLARQLSVSIVAVRDDRVIGMATAAGPYRLIHEARTREQADLVPMQLAKLHAVAVDPAHRGRGVGGALLEAITRLFEHVGVDAVYGECGPDATGFYRRLGFDVSAPGAPVDIAGPGPAVQLISGSPDECTFVRRIRGARLDSPEPASGGAARAARARPRRLLDRLRGA